MAAGLRHPNIVVVHVIACEGDRDFIVVEYVPALPSVKFQNVLILHHVTALHHQVTVVRGFAELARALQVLCEIAVNLFPGCVTNIMLTSVFRWRSSRLPATLATVH